MDIPRPLGGVPSVLLNDALTPPDNLPPAESDAANPSRNKGQGWKGAERAGPGETDYGGGGRATKQGAPKCGEPVLGRVRAPEHSGRRLEG